jgi:hypothetical protein
VRELSIVALSLLPLSSALAQPAAEQPPAGQGGGDAGAPPSGGGGEGGAPPEQGGAPPEPAKPEPTKPEPPKEEPKKPEPPPAVPEPPKETPHKGSFEFGSYGRVIAAVNGEGGPGRDADIVAHGSRMDEDNYMEAELRREDDWDKTGIHTNVVLTLALASPVFHWSGEFELNAAIRNMYLEARDIGVKGLTAWAGSRMVRGDDIYVLDWWPLDNLNLLGAGVSYAHEVGTSGQLVVGATQPNVPFFKQTVERPAPLDQYGSVAIPLLDRQKLIGALRLQHHQKFGPKDKPSPGLKAVLYGEGYALPEGQYEPEPGAELEQLPSDGGFTVGGQVTLYSGKRDTFVHLFARYSGNLAAYGQFARPGHLNLEKTTEGAREVVVAAVRRGARGGDHPADPRRGLARRGHLPGARRPLRRRRRRQQLPRRPRPRMASTTAATGRASRSSSTTSRSSASRPCGSPRREERRHRRRLRRLPRLLGARPHRANPHFGDLAALRSLVNACHERDMKVIVDIVTNHMGQLFFYDINLNGSPTIRGRRRRQLESGVTHINEYDPDFDPRGIQAFTSLGEAGPAPVIFTYDPATNHIPPQPDLPEPARVYNRKGAPTISTTPTQLVHRRLSGRPEGREHQALRRA